MDALGGDSGGNACSTNCKSSHEIAFFVDNIQIELCLIRTGRGIGVKGNNKKFIEN